MTKAAKNPEESKGDALRRGWTTGACATAATRAAYTALLTGTFPDPVEITLPKGQKPGFALATHSLGMDEASAGIVKDAGDDPDVTHGALVVATVQPGPVGSGVTFLAGEGVGTVTRAGLPLPVGEPAINPAPRRMIEETVAALAREHDAPGDVLVRISIPGGDALAAKTWNPRLGIEGGLSVLGTTGVVVPFSCSAWIHSIHRGIDVARAAGLDHIAGSTGSTSEAAVQALHDLPEMALIDMGDFVGGMLKYLRKHPVARVTVAGGFAKISKLAAGFLDLHSGRSTVDFERLSKTCAELGGSDALVQTARTANTAAHILELARQEKLPLADAIAEQARAAAQDVAGSQVAVEVVIFDRKGTLIGRAGA
jgi:cobalt-precorrin-5B (C1)-methyltransferase